MNKRLGKTMKKWMAGMLTILLVATANVIPAKAAVSGVFAYEIVSNQVYITDCDITTTGDLEIPETIEGYPVVSISPYAFAGCIGLTSITIPEGVISIGAYAFSECNNVTSIIVPSSVTSIGTYVFMNCKSLTSLELPIGITTIEKGMFKGCSNLVSLTIPEKVTSIGALAFEACSSLINITIPSGVASIGEKAFYKCSSLTKVTIPSGVKSIGASTFYGCSKLTNVEIPASVTSIGANAFYNCSSLSNVNIPTGVTSIGNAAFNGCRGLIEVTIPSGVASIGSSAFNGCSSLTKLTISEGTTSIGNFAFCGCSSLTELKIPNGMTNIGNNAFAYCYNLTDVSLPSTLKSIGNYTFSYCNSLENINIPEGVTSVGDYAFSECSSLKNMILPESMSTLGKGVFSGCSNLESVNIPTGITRIEEKTFYNCSSIETIVIPEEITSIGAYAFAECKNLKAIEIPEGVMAIENGAFSYCSKLTTVIVPQSVTNIGEEVFVESTRVVIYTPSEYVKNYAISACVAYVWIADKIEVKQLPNKIEYFVNEEFSAEGLILLAYHGEVTEEITSGYEVRGFDSSEVGTCTIIVEYNGQTTSFNVMIREVPTLRVSRATLQIENDITVLFKADAITLDSVYTSPYIEVTQEMENGETKSQTIKGVLSADGLCYEFKYTGVSAKELGDNIKVTIYACYGEELITGETLVDYSVMKYCTGLLAKTASEVGLSEAKMSAFRILMVDLINYGAEAQVYFNYKIDKLVTNQLTEEQKAYASLDSVLDSLVNVTNKEQEIIEKPIATWVSAGLSLKSKVKIRLKFSYAGDMTNVKLVAKVAGGNTYEVTEIESLGSGMYYAYFDEVRASQFSSEIDFQVVDGDTVVSNTLRYSIESYVANNVNNVSLGKVVSAMMKYGKAAVAYREAK